MGSWAFPVVIVGLVVARLIAVRQVSKGHRRFVWLYFAPFLVIGAFGVWAGFIVFGSNPVAGLVFSAVALVTLVLLVRMVAHYQPTTAPGSAGELSGPWFDYIIWMALGAPFILLGLLLVLALTGALNH